MGFIILVQIYLTYSESFPDMLTMSLNDVDIAATDVDALAAIQTVTDAPTEAPTFAPTFSPTFSPTPSPTFAPTLQKAETVLVEFDLGINGITAETYNSKRDINDQVIKQSIVEQINDPAVTVDRVTILSISDKGSRRLMARVVRKLLQFNVAPSSVGIIVTFSIYIPTTKGTNFKNGEHAFSTIVAILEDATTTGDLVTTIDEVANVVLQNNSFLDTTSITVDPVEVQSSNIYPAPTDKKSLSAGQIAGLVIGVLFGLIFIAIVIYALLKNRRRSYYDSRDNALKEIILVDGREVVVNEGTQV